MYTSNRFAGQKIFPVFPVGFCLKRYGLKFFALLRSRLIPMRANDSPRVFLYDSMNNLNLWKKTCGVYYPQPPEGGYQKRLPVKVPFRGFRGYNVPRRQGPRRGEIMRTIFFFLYFSLDRKVPKDQGLASCRPSNGLFRERKELASLKQLFFLIRIFAEKVPGCKAYADLCGLRPSITAAGSIYDAKLFERSRKTERVFSVKHFLILFCA